MWNLDSSLPARRVLSRKHCLLVACRAGLIPRRAPRNDASPLARISSDCVVVPQREHTRWVVAFP